LKSRKSENLNTTKSPQSVPVGDTHSARLNTQIRSPGFNAISISNKSALPAEPRDFLTETPVSAHKNVVETTTASAEDTSKAAPVTPVKLTSSPFLPLSLLGESVGMSTKEGTTKFESRTLPRSSREHSASKLVGEQDDDGSSTL
jgi:hypothetical protein